MKLLRKVTILIFLAIVGMVVSSTGVYAYPVSAGEWVTINYTGGPRFSNGGPFLITSVDNPSVSFLTLCLETNEYFTPGVQYYIGSITSDAIMGGSGGPDPDPLDPKSAYLYYHFIKDPYPQAKWSAVQEAVWYIEQEYKNGELPAALSAAAQTLYADALANAGDSSWGVGVLNMYTDATMTKLVQDFVTVPEPGILILLGIALSAVGLAARRFKI